MIRPLERRGGETDIRVEGLIKDEDKYTEHARRKNCNVNGCVLFVKAVRLNAVRAWWLIGGVYKQTTKLVRDVVSTVLLL